MSDLKPFN